jgi:ectoine hydroxylase-related dioxygenase (phytanoyl-CoA dioxygenase family)
MEMTTSRDRASVPAPVAELGVDGHCRELAEQGYTVIEHPNPELSARMRAYHLAQGVPVQQMLLRRDPMFAEAVLDPTVLAVVEYSVGRGALVSQVTSSVRTPGPTVVPLHSDQNWLPAPFPEQNYMLTVCWVHDEFSAENGATKIIPGSHRHRRHPTPEESAAEEGAIAIEAPVGSVAIWDGAVWHGNYPRSAPGERVVTHITYSRLALRPVEDYSADADALIATHGERMAGLLGSHDALDGPDGFDYSKIAETCSMGRS